LDARYIWGDYEVEDAHGRTKVVAIGIQNGHVIVHTPGWFKAAPEVMDKIAAALTEANEAARQQRGS
jgi:hypothetical protein